MQLRLVPSESTESYFEALRGYLDDHGCPIAFYSDKHSVFRATRQEAKGGQGMTQFGLLFSTDLVAMNDNVTSSVFNMRIVDENIASYGSELRTDMQAAYLTHL